MPPRGLNPAQRGQAGIGAQAADVMQTNALPPAPVTSGSGNWVMDMSGLTKLKTTVADLVTQFTKLDEKIQSINAGLGNMKVGGGKPGTSAGGTITAAPISFQVPGVAASSAWSGAQQPSGQRPGLTTGTMSFNNSQLGMAAGAEAAAQLGGAINSRMQGIQQGGVPIQLMGAQQGVITNTTTAANVSAFMGIKTQSQADTAQMMAGYQQNSVLSTMGPNSRGFANFKSFMNAQMGLNPGMSASQAMQNATALTSPQFEQWAMQRTGGKAGLFNAQTGQINSSQDVFMSLAKMLTGNPNLTPALAKQMANNPKSWTSMSNNLSNAGLSSMIPMMHTFMGSGMANVNANNGPISTTVAAHLLTQSTAGAQTSQQAFMQTAQLQNAASDVATAFQHVTQDVMKLDPMLAPLTAGMAMLARAGAQAASALYMLKAVAGGLGGMGGPGAAENAESKGMLGGMMGKGMGYGMLGELAGLGLSYGGSKLGGTGGKIMSKAGSTLSGAATGMMIGAMIPGLGETGISEVAGGLIGGALGLFGDPVGTGGMQPNLAHGITAMQRDNPNIQINSGYRTAGQQAALYAAKGGRGVARPGQSPHQLGKAADVGPSSQYAWIAANAPRYGLASDKSEPWHVQALGDPNTASSVTGAQVVGAANTQIGVPYSWGGGTLTGPSTGTAQGANTVGFDCSHFVAYVFNQVGISVPPPSQSQAKMGKAVAGIKSAQAGDLIFYTYSSVNDHVAIYIGNNKQIAAPQTGQKIGVEGIDTPHLSCIRRIIGGGAGAATQVVATAQAAVGQPSNDSHSSSSITTGGSGMSNTFIAGLSGSWLSGGGVGAGGGGAMAAAAATSGTGTSTTTPATSAGSSAPAAAGGSASQWVQSVLKDGSFPETQNNVNNMLRWMAAEEPPTDWSHNDNPLNINAGGTGSDTFPSLAAAAAKTAAVIKQSNMAGIAKALAANASINAFSAAVVASPWAGSHYGGDPNHLAEIPVPAGDPVGGFNPNMSPMPSGGSSTVSRGGRGGRGGITVNIGPITVTGTQSDAQNIASMISAAIKSNSDLRALAGT